MSYPNDRLYTAEHEWIQVDGDVGTVGLSWHAQDSLGDVVHFEAPEVGDRVYKGDAVAEVESVKAVSDVYSPVTGEIVEVNEELEGAEDVINHDPYGAGWLFKIKLDDIRELDGLLSAEAYQATLDD